MVAFSEEKCLWCNRSGGELARRLRGGSFRDDPFFLRAANRNNDFHRSTRGPEIGFRVVWPAERGGD